MSLQRKEVRFALGPIVVGEPSRYLTVLGTEVAPGLIVHKLPRGVRSDRPWRVTHEPSGYLLCAFPDLVTAWRYGKRLVELADWTRSRDDLRSEQTTLLNGIIEALCEVSPPPSVYTPEGWYWEHQATTGEADQA